MLDFQLLSEGKEINRGSHDNGARHATGQSTKLVKNASLAFASFQLQKISIPSRFILYIIVHEIILRKKCKN